LDFLMPLGLMINELVLNSIVHGQPVASTNQRLKLEGNKKRHCYELTFSDNGPGFDYSEKKLKAGLGLRFLNGLASQLKADVQFSFSRGSVCKIRLPLV
jgi:two-component sensor histidine kinase